ASCERVRRTCPRVDRALWPPAHRPGPAAESGRGFRGARAGALERASKRLQLGGRLEGVEDWRMRAPHSLSLEDCPAVWLAGQLGLLELVVSFSNRGYPRVRAAFYLLLACFCGRAHARV